MNKICLITLIAFITTSCNNNTQPARTDQTTIATVQQTLSGCYVYTSGKDSVLLHINQSGDHVSGKLVYNFYEKDRNSGTIDGSLQGDTLLATYSFMSEGMSSKRQVTFVKQGNALREGYLTGDEQQQQYDYSKGIVLQPAKNCDQYFK